jgi:hypothetical protein
MSDTSFKALERRVCRAFGGERRGPQPGSDCSGTPFAIEVKRTKNRVPEGRMIAQAELQGKVEHLPWILVVAGHRDRKPIATLELNVLLAVLQDAGWIPAGPTLASAVGGSTSARSGGSRTTTAATDGTTSGRTPTSAGPAAVDTPI